MKNNLATPSLVYTVLIFMTVINNVSAQTTLPNKPVEAPAIPIDGYIPLILVMGIAMGSFFIFRKYKEIF